MAHRRAERGSGHCSAARALDRVRQEPGLAGHSLGALSGGHGQRGRIDLGNPARSPHLRCQIAGNAAYRIGILRLGAALPDSLGSELK
ncbi:MAG: hypothetical protein ABSG64_14100 [Solirubrobacteraceae bacterium]